jgi:hypothetical protein
MCVCDKTKLDNQINDKRTVQTNKKYNTITQSTHKNAIHHSQLLHSLNPVQSTITMIDLHTNTPQLSKTLQTISRLLRLIRPVLNILSIKLNQYLFFQPYG